MENHPRPLGRRVPTTDEHIRKYPLTATTPPAKVVHVMRLPVWHWTHDQGHQGACVGHGTAMERTVREMALRKVNGKKPYTIRFDPWWFWDQAKLADEWSDTNPGDDNGTSVHAAYDVVRTKGAVKIASATEGLYTTPEKVAAGKADSQWTVKTNEWATTVDQMRACIARDQPVTIGVTWYTAFDKPVKQSDGFYYIGTDPNNLGTSRGGHSVCIYGANDDRECFRMKNSWGSSYPLVWLSYATMARLLNEDGEACVVTA